MIVYQVIKRWVDHDNWPISDPRVLKTFTTRERARQFMFEKTGEQSALSFGYVESSRSPSKHDSWYINEIEVEE